MAEYKKITDFTEISEASGKDFVELAVDDGAGGYDSYKWAPRADFAHDPSTTSGLTLGLKAGTLRNDNAIVSVAAGTVSLTDDSTNYIEVDSAGTVSANTSGFNSGSIPLYGAVTVSGAIDSLADKRSWLIAHNAIEDIADSTIHNLQLEGGVLKTVEV